MENCLMVGIEGGSGAVPLHAHQSHLLVLGRKCARGSLKKKNCKVCITSFGKIEIKKKKKKKR